MSVSKILDALLQHDLPRSLQIFVPELILCGTIVALLLVRLFGMEKRLPSCWVVLIGGMLAFGGAFTQFYGVMYEPGRLPTKAVAAPHNDEHGHEHEDGTVHGHDHPVSATSPAENKSRPAALAPLYGFYGVTADGVGELGSSYFTGMLHHDQFSVAFRLGLTLILVLMISLSVITGLPDSEDGQDFYTLLIGSLIGMMLACGANHLLMVFLAVEMMSVPSYAMVGFLKGRKQSSEAALKYVVYGAGAAGVMLYGISLVAGLLGTADLSQFGERIVFLMQGESFSITNANAVTLSLGVMMVLVGLAFKLSLFPFHFWCPDAFEGAAAEVGGYLSVASKAGAFALLVRFVLAFTGPTPVQQQFCLFFGLALGVIAVASMTIGNLAAYSQTNMKRLLAYSTIAHAGYMVLAVSALLVLSSAASGSAVELQLMTGSGAGQGGGGIQFAVGRCLEGLMVYLSVYLFMNFVAFAVIALVRNQTYREDIESYKGLFASDTTTKVLCVCLLISFFSLVGMPPFGGFFAKLMIFAAAFNAGHVHWMMWAFVALAGLNTVFSLFYYLNVLRTIFISAPADDARPLRIPGTVGAFVVILTVPILLIGFYPEPLTQVAHAVAARLTGM